MEIIRGWEWYLNSKNDINYAKSNHIWHLACIILQHSSTGLCPASTRNLKAFYLAKFSEHLDLQLLDKR